MRESTASTTPANEQPDQGERPWRTRRGGAGGTVPTVIREITTEFGWRHVKGVAAVRVLVALWLVCLGVVLCVGGHWWGLFLVLAAALVGLLAYLMPRWKMVLDAEKSAELSAERVRELEEARTYVVDDAAERLRHIGQDLHDGAQAQMVAVVMKLGLAREHLERASIPSAEPGAQAAAARRALELLDAAHGGAMEAIAELRDLVRGIHPPALGEGLGAALGTLAGLYDAQVELAVDLPRRPSAANEAIAYFCAAELLTNVAKHSDARNVTVEARLGPDVLLLRVSDDGRGGARIEAGGGLAGLVQRVEMVDGRLRLSSPPGGPTVVTVELPAPSSQGRPG